MYHCQTKWNSSTVQPSHEHISAEIEITNSNLTILIFIIQSFAIKYFHIKFSRDNKMDHHCTCRLTNLLKLCTVELKYRQTNMLYGTPWSKEKKMIMLYYFQQNKVTTSYFFQATSCNIFIFAPKSTHHMMDFVIEKLYIQG